jgi:hypothetical protein
VQYSLQEDQPVTVESAKQSLFGICLHVKKITSYTRSHMCEIHYTLYACGCWKPLPQPGTKTMLRLCKVSESNRLDMPCKEKDGLEHKVVNRSQGMCDACLWKKISK